MGTSLTKQIYPLPASILLSSIYLKRKIFAISFSFFFPPMLYDINTSCQSDSSLYHHAKVSWLLNAYCVTSDNYDNSAGHFLVLSSFYSMKV